MKLNCFLGDTSACRVFAVANFCGIEVTPNIVKPQDLKAKEFKKKLIFNTLPILDIDDNRSLSQVSAIIKYLESQRQGTPLTKYQQALLDQWLSAADSEIEAAALALIASVQGIVKFDKGAQKKAQDDILNFCGSLEHQLNTTAYILGDFLSVADYAIFTTLAQVFRVGISFASLGKYPKVKAWIETLAKDPHNIKAIGRVAFCQKPFAIPPEEAD